RSPGRRAIRQDEEVRPNSVSDSGLRHGEGMTTSNTLGAYRAPANSAAREDGDPERARVCAHRQAGRRGLELRQPAVRANGQRVQAIPTAPWHRIDRMPIDDEERLADGIEREPPRIARVLQRKGLELVRRCRVV